MAWSCLQTPLPVHRSADGHHEPSGNKLISLQHKEDLALAGASCVVMETTAGYKAMPSSLPMMPLAATLPGHDAALLPSPAMCQPTTVMTQATVTWPKSTWPNPAAVLQATMLSTVWQKQQQWQRGQQREVMAMDVSPDAMERSNDWLQLQHQRQQP